MKTARHYCSPISVCDSFPPVASDATNINQNYKKLKY